MSQPSNVLEFLFAFAMKLINGNEPLPKAAAAEFWVRPTSGILEEVIPNYYYRLHL